MTTDEKIEKTERIDFYLDYLIPLYKERRNRK